MLSRHQLLRSCSTVAAMAASASTQVHTIVHFDVNKTIICTDAAGGKSLSDVLNNLTADFALGHSDHAAGKWEINATASSEAHGLDSFSNFVEAFLPYTVVEDGATAEEAAAVKAHNRETRSQRQDMKVKFTHEGEPGESLAHIVQDLTERISLPSCLKEECAKYPFLADGFYHIIPAYFETIEYLAASGEPFGVVFRTFGSDLPAIMEEHNMYCEARHPAFPEAVPLDGSVSGRPNLKLDTEHTGRIIRHAGQHGTDLMALAMTTHSIPGLPAAVDIVTGPLEVAAAIESRLGVKQLPTEQAAEAAAIARTNPVHPVLALRDDYLFWHTHGETAEAGKLLLVDPSDRSVHSVFFDDNVGEDDACIVDVRNAITGEPMPFSETKNTFVVRANVAAAVRDPQYFVKQLQMCAANRAAKHESL
mgnify:CR=1 FL=1